MSFSQLPAWTPLFLFSTVLYGASLWAESRALRRCGAVSYDQKEVWANTKIFIVFALLASVWSAGVMVPFYEWVTRLSPWQIIERPTTEMFDLPWWQFVFLFLADDFCFYVYHRFMHRFKLTWALHETHHSSSSFNISVSAREPWVAIFFSAPFWIPLALLGFDARLITFQQWLNLTFQLLIHTEAIRKLGPLEFFLNTPSHHRVHHGQRAPYLDKNFGGVLIVWDKLFGTFEPETHPVEYGVAQPPRSYSPIAISLNGLRRYLENRATTKSSDLFEEERPLKTNAR